MTWEIPLTSGEYLQLTVDSGELAFLVGANGSGKSALVQYLTLSRGKGNIRRISAQRKAWFASGSIDLTPQRRRELDREFAKEEREEGARWRDRYGEQRHSAVLFDLVAKENSLARDIAGHVRGRRLEEAANLAASAASPFDEINELLSLGTFAVALENSKDEEILARRRDVDGAAYSIAQMSDGERNAAIIAANVLTVSPGTTIVIDEPERHLYRGIIVPILAALFESRGDCAFIISTHELALPGAFPDARVLTVRSCKWSGNRATHWDVSLSGANEDIPEDLRRAILGGRRKLLFVEGDAGSLDCALYNTLFPDVATVPRGGCGDVKRAVIGLRAGAAYHHMEAFGLVDMDNMDEDEVEALASQHIFALNVCSVESLYYCDEAIDAVARRQAETMGLEANEAAKGAKRAGLAVLGDVDLVRRMAARRCERQVRNGVLLRLPTWRDIWVNGGTPLQVKIDNPYAEELQRIETLVNVGDLDGLVARYPLRDSKLFDSVAKALTFPHRKAYERAVVVRAHRDVALARRLRQRVGRLSVGLGCDPGSGNLGRQRDLER